MNRDQFLAKAKEVSNEAPREVNIRGFGPVHVRELMIGDVDAQIQDTEKNKKDIRSVARGACRLVTDENGNLLLNPADENDVDVMAKLPLRVLRAINKTTELDEAKDTGN